MNPLPILLEECRRELGCEAVAVFVNSPERNRSELADFVGEKPRPHVPLGITPLGEAAAGGPAIHREVKNTKANKYHSHLYVPLVDESGPWGVVAFAAIQSDFFALAKKSLDAQRCAQCLTRSSLSG